MHTCPPLYISINYSYRFLLGIIFPPNPYRRVSNNENNINAQGDANGQQTDIVITKYFSIE